MVFFVGIILGLAGNPRAQALQSSGQAGVPVPHRGILGLGIAGGAEAPRLQRRDDGEDLTARGAEIALCAQDARGAGNVLLVQTERGAGNVLLVQTERGAGNLANARNAENERNAEAGRITRYTLTPERERKARALAAVRLRQWAVELVYGLVVLLAVLWWKLGAKYRDVAEKISGKRFVQVLVFAPLIALTIDVMELPTGIYENWLERAYGLSVQGWGSWFWDWAKEELFR